MCAALAAGVGLETVMEASESCLEGHFQQAFLLSCCNEEELVTVLEPCHRLVAQVLDGPILMKGVQN